MAGHSNKMTIRVHPNRTNENVTFSATGHFGKVQLRIAPQYMRGVPFSPTTDQKAYWIDVLQKVIAELQIPNLPV